MGSKTIEQINKQLALKQAKHEADIKAQKEKRCLKKKMKTQKRKSKLPQL